MSTVNDIIEKMSNAPNTISFREAEKVLKAKSYIKVRQKGSHAQFRNLSGDIITIKKEPTIKAVYVKDILKRIGETNEK